MAPASGVVGMCFTGGFALAMMVDDIVLAPVLSQPSLPFPLSKKFKADIGISDGDLARVKERTAAGTCLLGLRFTNDPFCFEERFETLRRELGDAFIAVEIDSAPGNPARAPQEGALRADRTPRGRGGHADPGCARPDADVLPGEARRGLGPRAAAGAWRLGTPPGRSGRRRRISSHTRSPERTAPSMAPYDVDAVSVPAQCSRPTGSRKRRPYWVSTPVGKWPMEQPRVHCSCAQFSSNTSTGDAAAGPSRLVSVRTKTSRRSVSSRAARARARGPAAYPATTPGAWSGWPVSSVTSISSSVATVAPDIPSRRQNGSS